MKRSIPFSALLLFLSFSANLAFSQNFDYGKTYINVSKGVNGGTVEPGDTLEIRTTFVVRASYYDSCAFYDTIRPGTQYIPSTLRILTNEGKVYKAFTDALLDDCGRVTVVGLNTYILINMGYNTADAPATAL